MPKKFIVIFALIILAQVFFSFFYSSEIITQNNLLFDNQQKYQELNIKNIEFQKQFAQLTSLNFLQTKIASQSLVPINKTINLNN